MTLTRDVITAHHDGVTLHAWRVTGDLGAVELRACHSPAEGWHQITYAVHAPRPLLGILDTDGPTPDCHILTGPCWQLVLDAHTGQHLTWATSGDPTQIRYAFTAMELDYCLYLGLHVIGRTRSGKSTELRNPFSPDPLPRDAT